jgi:hypothetical protein
MIFTLLLFSVSRESTNLYTSTQGTGDCFNTECSFNEAMLTLRVADVVHIKDKIITPAAYPSEFSDLIEGAAHSNVTLVGIEGGTVVEGSLLTGGLMYYLENQRRFSWAKFQGFIFRHFSKLLMSRQHSWSTYPQLVFQDCIFEDNSHDLFSTTGGHWIFINCVFRNNSGRIFKALSETTVEFIDCTIESSQAAFGFGADLIFRNCIFIKTFGQRGGAIHAAKSTLYVNKCKFIDTKASANGGAIYIRDSHEKYQSEISESCFLRTKAALNGTAIYSYLSYIDVKKNVFAEGEESFYAFTSEVNADGNVYNGDAEACLRNHQPLDEEDQFFPCDTYQRHEFDDAHGNIVMDFSNPDDPLEQLIA